MIKCDACNSDIPSVHAIHLVADKFREAGAVHVCDKCITRLEDAVKRKCHDADRILAITIMAAFKAELTRIRSEL